MKNRSQFTLRDLLIWTTALAAGVVLLKWLSGLETFQSSSQAFDDLVVLPASIIFPIGMMGIFVAPLGILVMLIAVISRRCRTYSSGLFLSVIAVAILMPLVFVGVYLNIGVLLTLLAMPVCSAICFIEAFYWKRNKNPESGWRYAICSFRRSPALSSLFRSG